MTIVVWEKYNNLPIPSYDLFLEELSADSFYINFVGEVYYNHSLILIYIESDNFEKSNLASAEKKMVKIIIYQLWL